MNKFMALPPYAHNVRHSGDRVKPITCYSETFDLFLNLKVHAIGIDLGPQIREESATMRSLDRFAERASRYGIRTYAMGVRSVSLTTAIVASGFDYVSGDMIAPPVTGPRGIREFDTGMLFQ